MFLGMLENQHKPKMRSWCLSRRLRKFELKGGRQYADMRAFQERDMDKQEFKEQLKKH